MTTRLLIFSFYLLVCLPAVEAQFHNIRMPQASPSIKTSHQLGISDITIEYSSPAARGRDIWNAVVPFDAQPLPWRAGANMNTRIQFSTDVKINGVSLKAGAYGFHIIPRTEGQWELVFAANDNLWGSYYLDMEKDVAHIIKVDPVECSFRETLVYDFIERTDSSLLVALEWAEKRIPFKVEVNLDETVVEHFRYQLRGLETYRWEAWNDAANWCAQRNVNLEEALSWANRSIDGGYGGFAANKNLSNLGTKILLLTLLDRQTEADPLVAEAKRMIDEPYAAYTFGEMWLRKSDYERAVDWYAAAAGALDENEAWYVHIRYAIALYMNEERDNAISTLNNMEGKVEGDQAKTMVKNLKAAMKSGEFRLR